MSEETFVNKVADSGIITINLEDHYPKDEIAVFDLKDYLFMGLILKEKDFRESLKNLDTAAFENKTVALFCSADAIIPVWAYMLVVSKLSPVAKDIILGYEAEVRENLLLQSVNDIDESQYLDQRVVIKGCGEIPVGEKAYAAVTKKLRPVVRSLMYGEPCSTVPVYKKPLQRG